MFQMIEGWPKGAQSLQRIGRIFVKRPASPDSQGSAAQKIAQGYAISDGLDPSVQNAENGL